MNAQAVKDREGVWHATAGAADDNATWVPIKCGEGIVMPGVWWAFHEVTCPECVVEASRTGGSDG